MALAKHPKYTFRAGSVQLSGPFFVLSSRRREYWTIRERLIGCSSGFEIESSVESRRFVVDVLVFLGILRRVRRYKQERISRISSTFPGFRLGAYLELVILR